METKQNGRPKGSKDKTKRKIGTWKFIEANAISNTIMFFIYLMIVVGGSK